MHFPYGIINGRRRRRSVDGVRVVSRILLWVHRGLKGCMVLRLLLHANDAPEHKVFANDEMHLSQIGGANLRRVKQRDFTMSSIHAV
mmetsp:Transcript_23363/g.39906  ORF Transcript_23363/g.39906 Transcript_23363/m.39906 type:complete len:87 (+) Transcript_23363:277-537(+)